ncbi:methyl-accepting chemotaxis protein [Marinobacter sp. X15-166B]|uniref:methyl-accepting chemotaxis protein n=1 Tax=Marinobacter sp. X15-166B TaxID=1897620 RepID=UPI0013013694|nr:HAMP domain-containing methyl-accepting chemotaxis protein [Marinobacter sp. X15-166B]
MGLVSTAFTDYSEFAVAIEKQASDIVSDTNYVSRLNRSIILGGDYSKDMAALRERISAIYGHYDQLERIAGAWPDQQVRQELAGLVAAAYQSTKIALDTSLQVMATLTERSDDAERQAAWVLYGQEVTPPTQASRRHFRALLDYINEQGSTIYGRSTDAVASANTVIVVAVLLAIATGLLASTLIARSVITPLQRLTYLAQEVEQHSRLYLRSELKGNDELGTVGRAIDELLASFERTISSIKAAADEQTELSSRLAETSINTSERVSEQQRQTETVASAMTEMASSAHEIARGAADAASAADRASTQASRGQTIVAHTIDNIDLLAQDIRRNAETIATVSADSQEIGRVLDVIGGIAEQTNLLALNAAIEAARAGEQGRGFAVVADEVRSLASRTNESTREIQDMIERLQCGAESAVQAMTQSQTQADQTVSTAKDADAALLDITQAVGLINDMAAQIATAAEQQTAANEEISRSINNITRASQETATEADNTQQTSKTLVDLAQNLRQQVAHFSCTEDVNDAAQ